jgi:hypothetical protein
LGVWSSITGRLEGLRPVPPVKLPELLIASEALLRGEAREDVLLARDCRTHTNIRKQEKQQKQQHQQQDGSLTTSISY